MNARRFARLLVLVMLAAAAGQGGDEWRRIRCDGFEVYTNQDVEGALRTLEHCRRFQRVVEGTLAFKVVNPKPIVILQAPEGRQYRPAQSSRSLRYATFPERGGEDVILLADLDERSFWRARYGCIWLTLKRARLNLPFWLRFGIAHVYANAELVHEKWQIGMPHRVPGVDPRAIVHGLGELENFTEEPEHPTERYRLRLETWLPAHMLMFSADYGPRFPIFFKEMTSGASVEEALHRVFHTDRAKFRADLDAYVHAPKKHVLVPPYESPLDAPVTDRPEQVEVDLLLAKALSLGGNRKDALASHERLLVDYGDDARVFRGYAMALPSGAESLDRRTELLLKAVRLDPKYTEARYLLGMLYLRQGQYRDALNALGMIREVPPEWAFDHFRGLALAFHGTGRKVDARKAADRALSFAKRVESKAIAELLLVHVAGGGGAGALDEALLAGLPE
jgi:tetratricopeptide (TPR) repeat protein